jgi:adenine-specific DNA-methyltransferase
MSRNGYKGRLETPELENLQVINRYTFTGAKDNSYLYIGRGTPLGNNWTHVTGHTQAQFVVGSRQEAIDNYRHWLWNEIKSGKGQAFDALKAIQDRVTQGEKVNLACSCKPEACHGDVIKGAVEYLVQQDRGKVLEPSNAARTVFVSGSRSISTLPPDAVKALDQLIDERATIFVGDAPGIDTLVQQHLSERNYDQVTVHHIGNQPRNNLGFQTVKVDGNRQTDKDNYMATRADTGLAIWDGQSRGTAQNIERLETTVINTTQVQQTNLSARSQQAHSDVLAQEPADTIRSLYNVQEGLTRGEHASQLNRVDQFTRDNFERGATISDTILSIPTDPDARTQDTSRPTIGTETHAINFVRSFIDDKQRATELGQRLYVLADRAAGQWTDPHGRWNIFTYAYDSIRKDETGAFRNREEKAASIDKALQDMASWAEQLPQASTEPTPEEVHQYILELAAENQNTLQAEQETQEPEPSLTNEQLLYLHELNSNSRGLATIGELTGLSPQPEFVQTQAFDENQLDAEIFEESLLDAMEFGATETDHLSAERQPSEGRMLDATFDRVDLETLPPAIPDSISPDSQAELLSNLLPRIDHQIENGLSKKEILSPIYDANRTNEVTRFEERVAQLFQNSGNLETAAVTRPDRLRALCSLRLLVAAEYKREIKGFTREAVQWAKDNYHRNPDRERADGKLKVGEYQKLVAEQSDNRTKFLTEHPGQEAPTRSQTARIKSLEIAGYKINDRIDILNPTKEELLQTLDQVQSRIVTDTMRVGDMLRGYETAEAASHHLDHAATQFADHVRDSDEFQTQKSTFLHNEHERAIDQKEALTRGNNARFEYLQPPGPSDSVSLTSNDPDYDIAQVDLDRDYTDPEPVNFQSNYPELTGDPRPLTRFAETSLDNSVDSRTERTALAKAVVSPDIELARTENARELSDYSGRFTQLTGHEVANAREARLAMQPTLAGLQQTTDVANTTRTRLDPGAVPQLAFERTPEPVYVSLRGNDVTRVPIHTAQEYEALTATVADCRLNISTWSSLHSPVEVSGHDEERHEIAKFIGQYVDFRLPDRAHDATALSNRNPLFRSYAQQLSDTRTTEELVEVATEIKNENYQLYQAHQAHKQDPTTQAPEQSHLDVGEMRELFLSVSPMAATKTEAGRMREVLHSFAIFGKEKADRVQLLAEGKIKPSATLEKLLGNLETRNTEASLRHFYASLQNPKPNVPNAFNLYDAHRSLPQYERDYLYQQALAAKYDQVRQVNKTPAITTTAAPVTAPTVAVADKPQEPAANQTASYQDYYGRADWLEAKAVTEATSLHNGISNASLHSSSIVPELTDLEVQTIGHVVNNFDADRQNLVAEHLTNSGNEREQAIADLIRIASNIQEANVNNEVTKFDLAVPENYPLSHGSIHAVIEHTQQNRAQQPITPETLSQVQTDAQRQAWQEIKAEAAVLPHNVDGPASTLYQVRDLQQSIDRSATLQDRARTAVQVYENHVAGCVAKSDQTLAQSHQSLANVENPQELNAALVREFLSGQQTELAAQHQDRFQIITQTLSQQDVNQATELRDYAAVAKNDYLQSFVNLDKDRTAVNTVDSNVTPTPALETLPAAERYSQTLSTLENTLLADHANDVIRSDALPNLQPGELDRLTVRDVLPQEVKEAANTQAREAAWQSFQPPEIAAAAKAEHNVDDRLVNAADAVMDKVALSQTLELQVEAARTQLDTFVNEKVAAQEQPLRDQRASTAFETQFRETLANIKDEATRDQNPERQEAASNLLAKLDQADAKATTLVDSTRTDGIQPLEREMILSANTAASTHAQEVERQSLYVSRDEQAAAQTQTLNDLTGRDEARFKELRGQLRALETKYEQSFTSIDDKLTNLATARMDVQIERELAQFEQLAAPAATAINSYMRETVREEGFQALQEPERHEDHVERIMSVFQQTADAHGISLQQSSHDLREIATNVFDNLTLTIDQLHQQFAHEPTLSPTHLITQSPDMTMQANLEADPALHAHLPHSPLHEMAGLNQKNGHHDKHQPVLPGDELNQRDQLGAAGNLSQTASTQALTNQPNSVAAPAVAQSTNVAAEVQEVALAI